MEELVRQLIGYLRGMWRFRWWGLALAWIVGIVGGVVIYLMPDKYESSARVFVDTQSILRPLMSGLAVQPNVDQQVAILSRTLISRPNVEKLITMADLDLGVRSPVQREALIETLTKGLVIRGTGRDNLFTLAYADEQALRAQRIVQAFVSLFVESGLGGKRQDSDTARRFIEDQIKNYEEKLVEAENRLKEFRLKNMGLIGDGAHDYVSQIAQANQQIAQARLELSEAENSRDSLRRQLVGEDPVLLPQLPGTSTVSVPEIDGRIDALKRSLDDMLQRYTDKHPDVVGARRVIEQLEKQKEAEIAARKAAGGPAQYGSLDANPVFQQMKLSLSAAEARVASLQARVSEYEARLAQLQKSSQMLPEIEAELTQLNRDYGIHKKNYESLVARRESANMAVEMDSQAGIAEFRLIDPPSLPLRPSAPNRLVLMPLAGLGGLAVGFALTFLISQLKPSFSDARSLRELTGLPVLGTVSMLATPERRRARLRGLFAFGSGLAGFVGAIAISTVVLNYIQG